MIWYPGYEVSQYYLSNDTSGVCFYTDEPGVYYVRPGTSPPCVWPPGYEPVELPESPEPPDPFEPSEDEEEDVTR